MKRPIPVLVSSSLSVFRVRCNLSQLSAQKQPIESRKSDVDEGETVGREMVQFKSLAANQQRNQETKSYIQVFGVYMDQSFTLRGRNLHETRRLSRNLPVFHWNIVHIAIRKHFSNRKYVYLVDFQPFMLVYPGYIRVLL